jgi:hypothetical protein
MKLLSIESDAKTVKGTGYGYLTGILYLAPAKEADGIHDLCSFRTDECTYSCLYGSGMAGVFPSIKAARVAKTLLYLNDAESFKAQLKADIAELVRKASKRDLIPAVRINGTSDLPKLAREMALAFPTVQFYDYTKIPNPHKRTLPNYHLTFSFSGNNLSESMKALDNGINVAVVFSGATKPQTWNGYRVIDGDASDLRFTDDSGVIVGLKAKGDARKLTAGNFVQIGA